MWKARKRLTVRTTAGLMALGVALAACNAEADPAQRAAGQPPAAAKPRALTQVDASAREDVPSALDDAHHASFPDPLVDPDQILPGGPPPGGIPAIDEPRFLRASDVEWPAGPEPVLVSTLNGKTRGYPIQVLIWHEIVNDTVGGVPVAVTYCPLCNSGVAFDRRVGDRVLSLDTSGRLFERNLVMYDRQTESLWPQLTGQASVGVLTGRQLKSFPIGTVPWEQFRADHPDAWVLSRKTGHDRPYGVNPYAGYDSPTDEPLFGPPGSDDRLTAKQRVIGISDRRDAVAIVRIGLAERGVHALTVGGQELVVWHRGGQVSALDAYDLAEGREVGTTGVFEPYVGGRRLTFKPEGGGFVDTQTESHWNVLGRATNGPLAGKQLTLHPHLDTFWFAWVAFHPDTRIVARDWLSVD